MHSPVRVVSPEEFFEVQPQQYGPRRSDFSAETFQAIQRAWRSNQTATALVRFTVQDFCSSMRGHRQFLFVGPDNSIKSWEDSQDKHLGDVPSRFHYPDLAMLLPAGDPAVSDPFVQLKDVRFSKE